MSQQSGATKRKPSGSKKCAATQLRTPLDSRVSVSFRGESYAWLVRESKRLDVSLAHVIRSAVEASRQASSRRTKSKSSNR